MAKQTLNSPSEVLKKLMDDYGLNPSKLGAAINLNQATLRLLLLGKSKISCLVALKFSKFFGRTPEYWLNLQNQYDLAEAAKDKELAAVLKNIKKAEKAPKEARGAAKKDDAKAKKNGKAAADSKKTTKTAAAARKSAADSKKTTKAAVTKRGAAKKLAADKSPAEPKPTGAKRGRKPKSATVAPVLEPDPEVFESKSLSAFESDSLFGSDPVFTQEPAPEHQEEETLVQETETFPPPSFPETTDSGEFE
ncbi:MAG: HigA family addiction module antidote protein [Treponema sp.]|jgi:addiction module HigA family antidote|nr:HigA family addiction module antidote protein [Treponema sp.]